MPKRQQEGNQPKPPAKKGKYTGSRSAGNKAQNVAVAKDAGSKTTQKKGTKAKLAQKKGADPRSSESNTLTTTMGKTGSHPD